MTKKVSVIIPTVEGDLMIDQCIESIKNSSCKNIEIIVVKEGKERSSQRNIGISMATGEYIFIPDSDWIITEKLIEECVNLMDKFDAVYIPETISTPGFFSKVRNWERLFYTGTPIDVVRFVKSKWCPMFDDKQNGTEDSDWDRRVRGKRTISKNNYFHHDMVNMIKYFKKKAYYTKSMNRFEQRNPNDKILNPKWRCFGVFIENGKWKRLISNPFMALCMFFLIFIRAVIYLTGKK